MTEGEKFIEKLNDEVDVRIGIESKKAIKSTNGTPIIQVCQSIPIDLLMEFFPSNASNFQFTTPILSIPPSLSFPSSSASNAFGKRTLGRK